MARRWQSTAGVGGRRIDRDVGVDLLRAAAADQTLSEHKEQNDQQGDEQHDRKDRSATSAATIGGDDRLSFTLCHSKLLG